MEYPDKTTWHYVWGYNCVSRVKKIALPILLSELVPFGVAI